ncbi:TPA: phage DNA ejection protein [Serratia marcescens]|nr:phage DNA ejection protein [Serratia marcescens]
MATWQLTGLTDMAPKNSNAPGSSVPAPMQYQQQPNLGLVALQGLRGVAEIGQAAQQQQQRQEFQKKLGGFVSQNDRAGAQKLIADYPQFMDEAQKQMGFIDAEQNKQTANAAMNLRLASQTNDPRAMQSAIQGASPVLQRFGLTPDEVYQSWQQDPQGFSRTADLIHLHADPSSYFNVTNQQQAQGTSQQNANTAQFSAQQGARQGDERLDLDRFKVQTDNQLRTREMSLKARIENASNSLEREKLNAELSKVKQAQTEKLNDKINTAASSIENLNQALGVGNELSGIVGEHPSAVSRAQGGSVGWAPNWADDTRTLSAKANEYNTKMVLPILKGTFGGNPTEGERAALMQSVNSLKSATNNNDFMRELNKTQDTIVRMQKRQISDLGIPVKKSSDEATDTKMLLQDPSLVKEYITAHGYLPESYYQAKLKGGM